MDIDALIEKLNLKPHPEEGGYFSETYRSDEIIPPQALPARYDGPHAYSTAIYYLLTPDAFSALHRLKTDEIFHFYCGDPVRMLNLYPDGTSREIIIGSNVLGGEQPQVVVPMGVWQGCRLIEGGEYALLGTTVAPSFEYCDYEHADVQKLMDDYPDCANAILKLSKR